MLPIGYSFDAADHLDQNGDHSVSPLDALILINAINASPNAKSLSRPELRLATPKIDVNGDGELSAIDVLQVIDFINAH